MYDHGRSGWLPAGEPFNAPGLRPSDIAEVVIHYIGTARAPRDSKVWMLNEHRRTMALSSPYSFMYNAHIGLDGATWEGRGTQFRNAANGSATNPTTWSIVFGVDGQNPASPAQVAGGRKLVSGIRQFLGRQIPVVPHRAIGSTQCPGVGITAQIEAGVFEGSGNVSRIAGNNRFETAALISREAFPNGAKTVYVASGQQFADGLAASSLTKDGPLLLTSVDVLPAATRREIERLRPERVVILGGTAAVSMKVESELNSLV